MTRGLPALFGLARAAAPRVVVCGVAWDGGNGVAPGARGAPAALRLHAAGDGALERALRGSLAPLRGAVADAGDVEPVPGEPRAWMDRRIEEVCGAAWGAGAGVLLLGGDHSVTHAAVRRAGEDGPVALLWLDAHTDTAEGPALTHKTVARALLGLPGVTALVQAGFRGYTLDDELGRPLAGRTVVTAADVRRHGPRAVAGFLPRGTRLYVSVDIDVLDPSVAPGTATPVPGGLTLDEVLALLRHAADGRRLIGCDLVEVNPGRDSGARTLQAGCVLLREAMLLLAASGGPRAEVNAPARGAGARPRAGEGAPDGVLRDAAEAWILEPAGAERPPG